LRATHFVSYGYEPQFGKDSHAFFDRIPPLYSRDGLKMEVEANVSHSKEGFYSTDTYTDNMIQYLQDWNARQDGSPFFAYLPYAAPHWPLQCSKEDREGYKGVYDAGPDALRVQRLRNLMSKGIYASDVTPAEVIAPEVPEWEEMSSEERASSSRAMETYAGMVTA
jgi:arylsulfatase A-like enzyme